MPGESTIALPMPSGKKLNVPKWGLIAGVGGLAAVFLFLKNKGAATATDATAAGDQAATDAAGGADLLSYIQDLFNQMQGTIPPGQDIVVTPTQKNRNPTPQVKVDDTPTPTFTAPSAQTFGGSNPSSLSQSYRDVPAPAKASTVTTGQSVAQKVVVTSSVYAAKSAASQPVFSSPSAPIVQQAGHGVQQ